MISASRAAPPWHVSPVSLPAHVWRSARSLWVFSPCLKMFTLLASLVTAGNLLAAVHYYLAEKMSSGLRSHSFCLNPAPITCRSGHSFRIFCCHPEPLIFVHIVHSRNDFVRLYHIHVLPSVFQRFQSYIFALFLVSVSFES